MIRPKFIKPGTLILIILALIAIVPLAAPFCACEAPTGWSLVDEAHAYKVEKICEEITTKVGKHEEDASPKKEEKKAEEKKPAGHH